MKKLVFLLLILLSGVITLEAKVRTVSNDPNQPAQFTDIQIACDSSSAGDTVYVQGSPNNYGSVSIKKKLYIIGAGIKPSGTTLYGYPSSISSISLDSVSYISGASGTIIEGLTFYAMNAYAGCKNIIIRRNRFNSGYYQYINFTNMTNLLIYNNIINPWVFNITNSTNVIIMNNIILTGISNGSTTTIISNNIFFNVGAFGGFSNSTITNNIFYYSEVTGTDYCNFSNNIGFGISTSVLQGTNSGGNNLTADPNFTYKYTGNTYNDLDNYHLLSSSPGKNAGTDGTDVGIYGGQYPFPISAIPNNINCITPSIPVVKELNILNSSVPANGTLNFSVKGYKATK